MVSAVSANLLNEMAGEAETLDLAKSNYQINSREVGDRFRRQVSSESSEPLDSNPSSTGSILTTFDRRVSYTFDYQRNCSNLFPLNHTAVEFCKHSTS